jgi:hypothetical protein
LVKNIYKKILQPSVVAHTCDPSAWEAEIMRIMVRGEPRQKVSKTLSQPVLGMVAHYCYPSYTGTVILAIQEV